MDACLCVEALSESQVQRLESLSPDRQVERAVVSRFSWLLSSLRLWKSDPPFCLSSTVLYGKINMTMQQCAQTHRTDSQKALSRRRNYSWKVAALGGGRKRGNSLYKMFLFLFLAWCSHLIFYHAGKQVYTHVHKKYPYSHTCTHTHTYTQSSILETLGL